MNNLKNKIIIAISAIILFAGSMTVMANKAILSDVPAPNAKTVQLDTADKSSLKAETPAVNTSDYITVQSLDIVKNPQQYLDKSVKFKAVFDKFSVLGLDYKPAFRDSQDYITFLIKRDDVTDHTIPLSEMKIFIKRSEAEKFIDLDSGDVIEVYGKVFSTALTDAWVDVNKLVVVQKIKKDKEKKA